MIRTSSGNKRHTIIQNHGLCKDHSILNPSNTIKCLSIIRRQYPTLEYAHIIRNPVTTRNLHRSIALVRDTRPKITHHTHVNQHPRSKNCNSSSIANTTPNTMATNTMMVSGMSNDSTMNDIMRITNMGPASMNPSGLNLNGWSLSDLNLRLVGPTSMYSSTVSHCRTTATAYTRKRLFGNFTPRIQTLIPAKRFDMKCRASLEHGPSTRDLITNKGPRRTITILMHLETDPGLLSGRRDSLPNKTHGKCANLRKTLPRSMIQQQQPQQPQNQQQHGIHSQHSSPYLRDDTGTVVARKGQYDRSYAPRFAEEPTVNRQIAYESDPARVPDAPSDWHTSSTPRANDRAWPSRWPKGTLSVLDHQPRSAQEHAALALEHQRTLAAPIEQQEPQPSDINGIAMPHERAQQPAWQHCALTPAQDPEGFQASQTVNPAQPDHVAHGSYYTPKDERAHQSGLASSPAGAAYNQSEHGPQAPMTLNYGYEAVDAPRLPPSSPGQQSRRPSTSMQPPPRPPSRALGNNTEYQPPLVSDYGYEMSPVRQQIDQQSPTTGRHSDTPSDMKSPALPQNAGEDYDQETASPEENQSRSDYHAASLVIEQTSENGRRGSNRGSNRGSSRGSAKSTPLNRRQPQSPKANITPTSKAGRGGKGSSRASSRAATGTKRKNENAETDANLGPAPKKREFKGRKQQGSSTPSKTKRTIVVQQPLNQAAAAALSAMSVSMSTNTSNPEAPSAATSMPAPPPPVPRRESPVLTSRPSQDSYIPAQAPLPSQTSRSRISIQALSNSSAVSEVPGSLSARLGHSPQGSSPTEVFYSPKACFSPSSPEAQPDQTAQATEEASPARKAWAILMRKDNAWPKGSPCTFGHSLIEMVAKHSYKLFEPPSLRLSRKGKERAILPTFDDLVFGPAYIANGQRQRAMREFYLARATRSLEWPPPEESITNQFPIADETTIEEQPDTATNDSTTATEQDRIPEEELAMYDLREPVHPVVSRNIEHITFASIHNMAQIATSMIGASETASDRQLSRPLVFAWPSRCATCHEPVFGSTFHPERPSKK
ncbi:hypothetical protein N3K66_000833 [Trichothecium roseum]|uniref:Uncharacterized protein n=1 Tax=Trichothecium roseum TaxID=47278 RepID=A0ACC0VDM3_9HYPO|nr:hypothetical protein N3K66_000833 [Trichothecium roseum]